MKTSVIVATINRQEHLANLLTCLDRQTLRPDEVLLSAPTSGDLCDLEKYSDWVRPIIGERGASAQRNVALDLVEADTDVVFFFDDDVTLHPEYLANAASVFENDLDVVGLTGRLLLDGAGGAPVSLEEGARALEEGRGSCSQPREDVRSLYGCNSAARWEAAKNLRFDEQLPLYSWLEDLDYSRQLAAAGSLVKVSQCLAVHHGSPSGGRQQHTRFGYSQITNPIYLWRKGSISAPHAATLIARPLLANLKESLAGETKIWRRARLAGNAVSAFDLLRGRITPQRITML